MVLYSVGDGIKPQSHASTPEMQEIYEAYFAEKGKRIDITNRFRSTTVRLFSFAV
jgi:hypothetical protein